MKNKRKHVKDPYLRRVYYTLTVIFLLWVVMMTFLPWHGTP